MCHLAWEDFQMPKTETSGGQHSPQDQLTALNFFRNFLKPLRPDKRWCGQARGGAVPTLAGLTGVRGASVRRANQSLTPKENRFSRE